MTTEQETYHALCFYTLGLADPEFVHQYVVDAFAAQHANEQTKPITLTFALAGLYLHVERQFTGRQVQRAHMTMAKQKRTWPTFSQPNDRGAITAADVMKEPEGPQRDRVIDDWCASVWNAYREHRAAIIELLHACKVA